MMLLRRRHWVIVLTLMVLGGAGGFGYAEVRAPEYQAKASLVVGELFGGSPTDDSVKASAALASSYADLVRREPVLGPVAAELRVGDWRSLQNKVHSQPGDKNPLLVQLQVTAGSPTEAERIAEAVARQLVALTADAAQGDGRTFTDREIGRLESEIRQTEERIEELNALLDGAGDSKTAADLLAGIQHDRKRLIDLESSYHAMLDRFTAGSAGRITIIEHAYATTSPVRPDPIALTVAGVAVGLMLAVAWLHLTTRSPGRWAPAGPPPDQVGEVRPMRAEAWGAEETPRGQPRREGGRR